MPVTDGRRRIRIPNRDDETLRSGWCATPFEIRRDVLAADVPTVEGVFFRDRLVAAKRITGDGKLLCHCSPCGHSDIARRRRHAAHVVFAAHSCTFGLSPSMAPAESCTLLLTTSERPLGKPLFGNTASQPTRRLLSQLAVQLPEVGWCDFIVGRQNGLIGWRQGRPIAR